jgi:hypothetical protein
MLLSFCLKRGRIGWNSCSKPPCKALQAVGQRSPEEDSYTHNIIKIMIKTYTIATVICLLHKPAVITCLAVSSQDLWLPSPVHLVHCWQHWPCQVPHQRAKEHQSCKARHHATWSAMCLSNAHTKQPLLCSKQPAAAASRSLSPIDDAGMLLSSNGQPPQFCQGIE